MGIRHQIQPPVKTEHVCKLEPLFEEPVRYTLVACEDVFCYRWYFYDKAYALDHYIGMEWFPVRWWNFKLRKRIREFMTRPHPVKQTQTKE